MSVLRMFRCLVQMYRNYNEPEQNCDCTRDAWELVCHYKK